MSENKNDKVKVDLGLLEEDDEFEEFPAENWTAKDEDNEDISVWEDNWDDDDVEDDFNQQLRNFEPNNLIHCGNQYENIYNRENHKYSSFSTRIDNFETYLLTDNVNIDFMKINKYLKLRKSISLSLVFKSYKLYYSKINVKSIDTFLTNRISSFTYDWRWHYLWRNYNQHNNYRKLIKQYFIKQANIFEKDKIIKYIRNEVQSLSKIFNAYECNYNASEYLKIQMQQFYSNEKKDKYVTFCEDSNNVLPHYAQKYSIFKKYWSKRYKLFSKFDNGIQLDYESWFSVTPEKIAKHIANRCRCEFLIDAFCGAGGNSIHFAFTCTIVYAIDIDPQKIAMARHNAKIYGVDTKIEFILGDFFYLVHKLIGDVVFLSPPWGGPSYINTDIFDLQNIMSPKGGITLYEISKKISNNIAYYLPKNINTLQLTTVAGPGSKVEIEKNYLNNKLIAVTAYFGNLLK